MARFYTVHGSSRYYTIGYTHLCITHGAQTIFDITKQRAKEEKKTILKKKMRFVFFFETSNLHLITGLGLGEASPTDFGPEAQA